MNESPPANLSRSGSRKIQRKHCTYSQPDARVSYNASYKRWTVQILPHCHVKTFKHRKEAQAYAADKKQELATATPTHVTHDPHTQTPVIEV